MAVQEMHTLKNPVRFVTASSLFDGHDASINIMRRLLQSGGAEVIHLGHNRSVEEIVNASIQEDVQGIAISSYQGGHMEYFKYCYDLLQEKGAGHIRIYGGGGGVINPPEIKELHEYGIAHIFSPDDGRTFGLRGMINQMLEECDFPLESNQVFSLADIKEKNDQAVARFMTVAENENLRTAAWKEAFLSIQRIEGTFPVLGITGTGGAGKSSLTDELVRRFLREFDDKTIAILSIDPTKQKTGGALLGDRIRMNAIHHPRVFMRSLATRSSKTETSSSLRDAIQVAKAAAFDLIIVETSGIGQGDAEIAEIADVSLYVMTSEFGAPSQLEKIDMIDFADVISINKFDRKGSEDALRDVRKQYQRSREWFDRRTEEMPVYGTIASQFNDPGTNILFSELIQAIRERCGVDWITTIDTDRETGKKDMIIPADRTPYLREIVQTVRGYKEHASEQAETARKLFQIDGTLRLLEQSSAATQELENIKEQIEKQLDPEVKGLLDGWEDLKKAYNEDTFTSKVRDKEIVTELNVETLSGLKVKRVALPRYKDWGAIAEWRMLENIPGSFPFTAGVFPFKRKGEDPKRQFAGEGTPARTNRRFHYLSKDDEAKRLSTAFDSVTLYGEDPDERPDIYGKVGESGVSICTLEDMKKLYEGFDLISPMTSVSMTINGPAPIILAMFMNTAVDQQIDLFAEREGREASEEEKQEIKAKTLATVRGTVQADILKEDQGQNTCIFSTEFALRMMGDIQQYFIDNKVRNYYSVSISGYHIAEAGANPISQVAFTLSNAFTYVEYYLSRGMHIDEFAANLSFFFSNGLDAEYAVIGRVARRIWAVVMKEKYGGNERSQKLKYHVQTSGRSLHAQEVDFNDIRTTLQALLAIYDNCNSLHTNAYDEAVTTPTESSVRRAMAIQMIITKELGLAKNENSTQGSFILEEMTDLVEEAVLQEMSRIDDRGGVLGAMETQYQRGKIQEESMYYEMKKHTGELPIIGKHVPDAGKRGNRI
ncbi:fused isobutyryl-CoA mutase/GTPase IcmF [Sinobaca sp. H24]|uniref:fused isobutyryl-CoA mutase/GTPase IcmF n=1 Tax=Sinobaca sp. H24 TaxID=2923376 RepID=UPI0035B0FB19